MLVARIQAQFEFSASLTYDAPYLQLPSGLHSETDAEGLFRHDKAEYFCH